MRYLLMLLMVLFAACGGVKTVQKPIDESEISENVKIKLDEARALIRDNKPKPALAKLSELNDNNLAPIEKALKYNLKGVTLFNIGEVPKSLLNFEVAEKYTPKDSQLYSQVQLNMASGHYMQNQYNELKSRLGLIQMSALSPTEKKKFAQLELAYGSKFKNDMMIVTSSAMLLDESKTFAEVQGSHLYAPMKESFDRLSPGDRIGVLEKFNGQKNLAAAYLGKNEAESRLVAGDKSGANDLVSWLRNQYPGNDEVANYLKEYELRISNSSRISPSDIGLVLPLTGDKANYGQKALAGVDTGLKVLGLAENIKVHTKDSIDSPARGAEAVLELIREDKVSLIIGGLFPESATAEYLEARKYGVLYISLSQINLPKDEKNHHLIEVQGSIESQVATLLSDEMINKFGTRLGVIYPENEGGKAYLDEIWRKSTQKNLQVTSIAGFEKNTHDFRDTAQLFLGLKYPRERSEELKILEDVYEHEKTSIRRVQTLPPVIDFDWVFIAGYPHEATQLIPTLGYYDATRLKTVGGPSWVSKTMVKEQKNLGTLYFVGDDPKDINHEMLTKFQEIYGKPASFIEVLSLDAMKIGSDALGITGNVGSRDDFDARLKSAGKLKGLTTEWDFKEGVWLKKMNAMTITRGEIVKLFEAGSLQ
ncbi:MAG: ABC transporter substrate-binding protein [Bacteriovoracaceae bacterium]